MDSDKIRELRNRIAIPLDIALNLLKKNGGDVFASERDFHNDNIKEIVAIAGCDDQTARESYTFCNYDKVKAIEKINSRPIILATKENPIPRNEIGFLLWPENKEGQHYKTTKRNDAFIPTADFDHILKEFESVFPLENSCSKDIIKCFDVCGYNYLDNTTCRIIIERMSQSKTSKPEVAKFKEDVINWLNDKLKYADHIVVYGNL